MVKDVLAELFPPDVPRIVRWRLVVAGVMTFMVFHILWACGLLPGVSGFAQADDVYTKFEKIQEKLEDADKVQKKILQSQLAAQLRDLHKIRCASTDEHVTMRLDRDIDEAQQEYREVSGERYPLPPCRDL